MNKKSLLALSMAIFIPLSCYLVIKWISDETIDMPRRYFSDTTITKTVDGKTTTDTIWHKAANIKLVNQLGDSVSLYDIQNRMIVVDFFFTHCPSICPVMTKNMAKLQQSFAHLTDGRRIIDSSVVRFLSFSIDPERDSFPVLKKYADKFGVNHDNWWMLTGPKKEIYDFALNELKLGLQDGEGVDTAFIHSQKFILLDREYVVRGYYDGLDTLSLAHLAKDIGLLMMERDKKKKRNLFRK